MLVKLRQKYWVDRLGLQNMTKVDLIFSDSTLFENRTWNFVMCFIVLQDHDQTVLKGFFVK